MESEEAPSYVLPLFFTGQTQGIFKCVADEDVTEENPYKLIQKDDILQDFRDRAAISDFHPAKKIVQNWTLPEILVVYDPAFQYGQNFYMITSEEQAELLLNPPQVTGGGEEGSDDGDDGKHSEEEMVQILRYGLRTPKPWISYGSEQEVIDEMTPIREKVTLTIARKRYEFGAPIDLMDRDENDLKTPVVIDCASYEDESFIVEKKELDKSVQHVPVVTHKVTQTNWPCPRNANVQYSPRSNPDSVNSEIMLSHEISEFFMNVIPRFELALQQNATLDIFTNDYTNLGEEDKSFGSKSDNHLREYQSFTDLQFSKNKTISSIQWHPTVKGLIAVSCMEHMSFYERVDSLSKCLMTRSLILIWSFADPIHPLLLLEAPDDIICFQFNPLNPDIVCGGCINGQIVIWDISKYSDLIKNHRTHGQGINLNQNIATSIFNTNKTELSPIVRYCAVSSIENSHRFSVTDIMWIPDHMEIGRMGLVYENKTKQCTQIMTCSPDGSVLIWDTKVPKSTIGNSTSKDNVIIDQSNPFYHLDLTWKPVQKVSARRVKGSGEYSPVKFSISEVQAPVKKSDLESLKLHDVENDSDPNDFSKMSFKKKGESKQLEHVNTKFYVGTEDGELIYMDWKSTKDIDTGKIVSPGPEFVWEAHDNSISSLQKSPFLKDIFLTVGGWSFSIWKNGVTFGPIFKSGIHECKLASGHWSPSRPGVFFIGRNDGNIDVWDLLDKSHEPFLTQNVTPVPVISVVTHSITSKQQLLAAGDEVGTLHIMEVPWTLRQSPHNELNIIENYLEREASRLQFIENRHSKSSIDAAKLRIKDDNLQEPVLELDEEWEVKARVHYEDYLILERRWLTDLGMIEEIV